LHLDDTSTVIPHLSHSSLPSCIVLLSVVCSVWVSSTQGTTWLYVSTGPFPNRFHAKLLAASNGVLLLVGGATEALPTDGGNSQAPSVNLNDAWASLDGGYTWGLCTSSLFPVIGNASLYPRGTGRQDVTLSADPASGYVYVGAGQGINQAGSQVFFNDMYRSSLSLLQTATLAVACNLTVPAKIGLSVLPPPPVSVSSSSAPTGGPSKSSASSSSTLSTANPAISSSTGATAAAGGSSSSALNNGAIAGIGQQSLHVISH
jgi:hypothetical protein